MKALVLLLQLFLLSVSLFLARTAAAAFPLIYGLVVGAAGMPLSYVEFRTVLVTFFVSHLFLYLISLTFHKELLFFSLKRTLDELYFVILGTTFSLFYIFLFTDVSFDVNFFAYAYIFNSIFYILVF